MNGDHKTFDDRRPAGDAPDWTARARELLDESTTTLDAAALSRLNRSRQVALAQRRRPALHRWLPVGAAAAASLFLALVATTRLAPPISVPVPPEVAAGSGDDAELIVADDNLDLAQDLEFYAWLDAEDEHNG